MQRYKIRYVQSDGIEHTAIRTAGTSQKAKEAFESEYPQYTVVEVYQ